MTRYPIMSEQRLRAYIKCSQFFHFGGEETASISTLMAQYATEYYLTATIRDPGKDRSYKITRAILQARRACELDLKYLTGQAEEMNSKTALWLEEFWNLFNPNVYLPVTGPLPWRTVVGSTRVDLQISGILRTAKNGTLHIISFTPYNSRHSQVNDPITHLKLNAMRAFVKKNPRRTRAVLHLLWARSDGSMGYDRVDETTLNPQYLSLIELKVKEAEAGLAFPVLPCKYTCQYKTKCFPGEKK